MADTKVSALADYETPQPADLVLVIDTTGPTGKKTEVTDLQAVLLAPAGNMGISAGYSLVIGRSYTVASGKQLTLGSGARVRIL